MMIINKSDEKIKISELMKDKINTNQLNKILFDGNLAFNDRNDVTLISNLFGKNDFLEEINGFSFLFNFLKNNKILTYKVIANLDNAAVKLNMNEDALNDFISNNKIKLSENELFYALSSHLYEDDSDLTTNDIQIVDTKFGTLNSIAVLYAYYFNDKDKLKEMLNNLITNNDNEKCNIYISLIYLLVAYQLEVINNDDFKVMFNKLLMDDSIVLIDAIFSKISKELYCTESAIKKEALYLSSKFIKDLFISLNKLLFILIYDVAFSKNFLILIEKINSMSNFELFNKVLNELRPSEIMNFALVISRHIPLRRIKNDIKNTIYGPSYLESYLKKLNEMAVNYLLNKFDGFEYFIEECRSALNGDLVKNKKDSLDFDYYELLNHKDNALVLVFASLNLSLIDSNEMDILFAYVLANSDNLDCFNGVANFSKVKLAMKFFDKVKREENKTGISANSIIKFKEDYLNHNIVFNNSIEDKLMMEKLCEMECSMSQLNKFMSSLRNKVIKELKAK